MKEQEETKKYALERMRMICSKSEKCEHDIRLKLDSYPLDESEKDWVITRLFNEKFLDNERYTGFFVRDKFRFNKWGKLKIKQALYLKKIPEEVVEDALNEIDPDEYYRLANELLHAKNKSLRDNNIFSRKAKLFRFLAQKGFEPDIIYQTLNDIPEKN